jgi:NADH:ubiquinone oxidoreductase subunit 6 (subunit J)
MARSRLRSSFICWGTGHRRWRGSHYAAERRAFRAALIVTLLSLAGLYLMLYAPFVAGVQIIVYAGGIMVLFLFVIMLVNVETLVQKERQFNRMWPVGLAAACALLALFVSAFVKGKALFPIA